METALHAPFRFYQLYIYAATQREMAAPNTPRTRQEPRPPASSSSPSSPSTRGFASFRSVVEAGLQSLRNQEPRRAQPQPSAASAPTSASSSAHTTAEARFSPTSLAAWQTAPWQQEQFPPLDPAAIKTIWKGEDPADEQLRHYIAKAYEEMQLNWNLDPRLVGRERSEANQGAAAIVAFLQRLAAATSASGGGGSDDKQRTKPFSSSDADDAAAGQDPRRDTLPSSPSSSRPTKSYERHDLLRAIERQDHEAILEIRNHNFDLLLDSAPGTSSSSSSHAMQTPLGYAISLGPKYTGTAVVITGAMSKYVNTLPDEQVFIQSHRNRKRGNDLDPRTMERLRKLRGTLKLAVDHSLATDQTQLLSSYVQVLFMSSGTSFIDESVAALASSLRSLFSSSAHRRDGSSGSALSAGHDSAADPVAEAREIILQFVNQGLKKREKVAAVSDLVDNAAGDLVIMAAWECIRPRGGSNDDADDAELQTPLPSYAFARDDRIATIFISRVDSLRAALDDQSKRALPFRRVVAIKDALQGLEKGMRRMDAGERIAAIKTVLR